MYIRAQEPARCAVCAHHIDGGVVECLSVYRSRCARRGDYATGILRECPGLCRSIGQNESLFGLSVVDNARTDQVFVALLDVESIGYGFEREFDSCIITACQRQCLFGFVIRVSGGESLTVIGESRNQLKT